MKQTKDTSNKDEQKFTRLTLEQGDIKIVWEVPYDDVTGDDMMQAIRTIMIGMAFCEDTIETSMASYLYQYSDMFQIQEVDNNNNTRIMTEDEMKEELAKVNDKLPKA